jgi:hypothetical protein
MRGALMPKKVVPQRPSYERGGVVRKNLLFVDPGFADRVKRNFTGRSNQPWSVGIGHKGLGLSDADVRAIEAKGKGK